MTTYTIEAFEDYCNRPGNGDRLLELIDGEIVQSDHVSTRLSEIPLIISGEVHQFCRERVIPCRISGVTGAYNILGNVITPNLAYKRTPMSMEFADPVPPLWAVEVISPTDKATDIRRKRQIYLQAGILFWELYPKTQSIDVYAPGKPMQTVGIEGTLDGGDVLREFRLPVNVLFAE